ncbi:DUF5107 domain-containing protein [Rahnella sp. FC061912-K]|uniref:DUF5107 domain-containing protein n=1 Tax=Rahnella rivi TaxID=2816249 RepID=UPI001C257D2C|nr:DUF5107 domain-containing protein [Rahnella rivi]MBU9832042.1 DUF5107 domain-containing protein [Rahnella rivi]
MSTAVKVWQEAVELPTWLTGKQDTHPMFLAHRVYQGSSGAVYPYGVTDTLTGEKVMKTYQALYLENDYLKIMLLPELGGRVHRAWDKIKQRDFVYYNDVVKPALVGLLGPWISGGIEFNWPQHHRPTTFMPVDFTVQAHDNGAQTVWMGEVEPMRGLQVMTGFTLFPDKALLEISAKIYNGNPTPRHFLWWANPAVTGGDGHQSVFPPDVTAVFDHGKRDVSSFPIATGTYYKVDYSAGVDISRYKNIPVPTSYMADKSDYDFVGAYDHEQQGGLLHIADHHVSPGKKQWTWGNCDFGRAWDRNLTDNNGPYIELMTGVFTDNQPDFTWLDAYEEKCFVQNFLPYSDLGTVQNASEQAVIKLERHGQTLAWGVYAVSPLIAARIEIASEDGTHILLEKDITLQPGDVLQGELSGEFPSRLRLRLRDDQGHELLSYLEHQASETPLPSPASAPLPAQDITSADEAWFIGQHLEQYNHASQGAVNYYRRGVELDPLDYRCNLALATLSYNQANFSQALALADAALSRAHRLNKNPQCGLASLVRANALEQTGDVDAAFDSYYRAVWSGNAKSGGFFGLARIATRRGQYPQALNFCEQGLATQANHYGLIGLKATLLCLMNQDARTYIEEHLQRYPLHYLLHFLRYHLTPDAQSAAQLRDVTGQRGENAMNIADQLTACGLDAMALDALNAVNSQETLPLYLQASLQKEGREALCLAARNAFPQHVRFPQWLAEVRMLAAFPDDAFALHLLASFHYSKGNTQTAVACWQRCLELEPDFADAWRGLGIDAWNQKQDATEARRCLEEACRLQPQDARLLFESDLLNRLTGVAPQIRLARLEKVLPVATQRDDLTAELLSLYHQCGQLQAARALLADRKFHPWEGGEGRITGQYLLNKQLLAFDYLNSGDVVAAQALLLSALKYPQNLSEGRLVGQTDNDICFWLGICAQKLQQHKQAQAWFERAAAGDKGIGERRYYNDQPVDYVFYQGMALRKLNDVVQSRQVFWQMLEWAESAAEKPVHADFFAVSLPDLVVLTGDRQKEHRIHCLLVKALALRGLEDEAFADVLQQIFALDPACGKAHLFSQLPDC